MSEEFEKYTREFERQSTLANLKRYSKVQILKRVQIFFFVGFLSVSVALLLTQTVQSINVFLDGPTYTETLLLDQKEATFPEITICPLNPFKPHILAVLKSEMILSVMNLIIISPVKLSFLDCSLNINISESWN